MLNLVEMIVQNIGSLLPFKVIMPYEQGVRYFLGKAKCDLNAGFHWFVPKVYNIELVDTVPQVVNLPTQSVVTQDKVPVCIASTLEYEIFSALKLYVGVQDPEMSMKNTGMGYLARYTREYDYPVLCRSTRELEKRVQEEMNTKVNNWGINVNHFYITDLVKSMQLKLFQDTMVGRTRGSS